MDLWCFLCARSFTQTEPEGLTHAIHFCRKQPSPYEVFDINTGQWPSHVSFTFTVKILKSNSYSSTHVVYLRFWLWKRYLLTNFYKVENFYSSIQNPCAYECNIFKNGTVECITIFKNIKNIFKSRKALKVPADVCCFVKQFIYFFIVLYIFEIWFCRTQKSLPSSCSYHSEVTSGADLRLKMQSANVFKECG